jgi:adenosine kinase
MNITVTGSLAYDYIMVFKDEFANHILPEKTHMLSVCFNVDALHREFGGTAGNIAFSLKLLDLDPMIVATVGRDFSEYRSRFEKLGISTNYILEMEDEMTAQAFITTDLKDNQIAAFHGGAMYRAEEQALSVLKDKTDLVIITPNGIQAMVNHSQYCRENEIPFWFDPGQAMSALSKEQLIECVQGAQGLIVNDYEWQMFRVKTGHNLGMVLEEIPIVLETLGEKGVNILTREGLEHVHAVRDVVCVDPTGAGDAFRAGLLYGLQAEVGLVDSVRYANAAASFAVEVMGTQNHQFTLAEVEARKKTL